MNLAVEYVLRRRIAQDAIQFPCSLFLTHLTDIKNRLILIISEVNGKYLVQKWEVKGQTTSSFPPRIDTLLSIFTSQASVIPMYRLLPFLDSPYETGVKQVNDGYRAMSQNQEYNNIISSFMNPLNHQQLRKAWLWATFLMSISEEIDDEVMIYQTFETQMATVNAMYPNVWTKWTNWLLVFNIHTEVATELVFHTAYEEKIKKETNDIVLPEWHPWDVFEKKPKKKQVKIENYGWGTTAGYFYSPYIPVMTSSVI